MTSINVPIQCEKGDTIEVSVGSPGNSQSKRILTFIAPEKSFILSIKDEESNQNSSSISIPMNLVEILTNAITVFAAHEKNNQENKKPE